MKFKYVFSIFCILPMLMSCDHSKDDNNGKTWEEIWTVGSETIERDEGLVYFWIKRNDNPVWEMTSAYIQGFTYEPGYEYKVRVQITEILNPPADASSWSCSLISVISKEKKDSDVPQLTSDISSCIPDDELLL